ncbi:MAG: TerC/Alx family metal homeostasis membrane protein [Bacteroidales bacterium]|nr:TerC/Alx family metal homeostasis membrane protein [Bacteroidales bacterium]MCF8404924.1 TerC/Alx family metal homeostasis membrane protein [Bacteroidales bacterium]
MVSPEIVFFSVFLVVIFVILLLDLGVFTKSYHKVGFREAVIWSIAWVTISIGFYFFLIHFGYLVHGIENLGEIEYRISKFDHPITIQGLDFAAALKVYENNLALEYITGYVIEKSLSVDNIFVIILIFYAFGVDEKYYKRVLLWGIIGAVIMRFIFIFVGAALVREFQWILYVFGLFLIFTAVKLFIDRNKTNRIEPERHPVVKFTSKYFRVHKSFEGHRFFIKKEGKLLVTPLFIVLLVIEFSDVIFAVDSIPAIFAVSKDPYIIFFSNIFAILGLRALFFLLANILNKFHYIKIGLAILLGFIGLKMLAHHYLEQFGFKTIHSLYIILGILSISILASIFFPPAPKKHTEKI